MRPYTNRFHADQAEHNEGTNRLSAKDKKNIFSHSLQSAHDEDATFRNKAGKSQRGYIANLSETCSKDNPFHLITDYKVATKIGDRKFLLFEVDRISGKDVYEVTDYEE